MLGHLRRYFSSPRWVFFMFLVYPLIWGLFFPSEARSQNLVQDWVARYDGGNRQDVAGGIATDAFGNIYVSGSSCKTTAQNCNFATATVKYDPSGTELWVARYNGASGSDNQFAAISVDNAGNVYITMNTCINNDCDAQFYTTVKYDTNGNQLWVAEFDGFNCGCGSPFAIKADPAGNVYVTGEGINGYTTVKYDANGAQLWVATYNGGGSGPNTPLAIEVDASGNVYVTGSSFLLPVVDGMDYATVKYDPNGNQLWAARYDNGKNDQAVSIALDASGNLYVTGNSADGANQGVATIKYDPNGNQLWVARSNGGGSSLFVDSAGNVYMAGAGSNGANSDFLTVKYDPNGAPLWTAQYDNGGHDFSFFISPDSSGNLYVGGSSCGLPDPAGCTHVDYALVKYDPNGNQLLAVRYDSGRNDYPAGFSLDSSGNVYITGESDQLNGVPISDYLTVKFKQVGNNTPVGNNVTVSPGSGTTVTFSQVVTEGNTTTTTSGSGPTPPAGFQTGTPPTYYDISTTAIYTPPVTVCITYNPAQYGDPSALRLFHFESGAWVDVTTSNDTINYVICSQVSSLSPFAIFQPVPPLGPANVWIGLKNSDDVGIKFDLKVEVYRNGSQLAGTGSLSSVAGGSSGFNNAHLRTIAVTPVSGVTFSPGDSLSMKLFVRNACSGSGKNSGAARLWFNDNAANSRFDSAVWSPATRYLVDGFALSPSAGLGPKKTIDVAAGAKCSAYKLFGTWSATVP